ncbi:MAG: sulfatase [Candidatus Fermentibacteraceae bacterium]
MLHHRTAAFALLALLLAGCGSPEPSRPNVVLVIIDTLRADRLGCYGYGRDTSPGLDSLAAEGMRWTRVQGQSSWTLPAVTTILTGLSPRAHGARLNVRERTMWMVSPEAPTAASLLGNAGYRTLGLFNVVLLSERMGFHRGFHRFHCSRAGHGMAGESVDRALAWLEGEAERDEPFLLVLHLFDPHSPYDPPQPWDTLYASSSEGDTAWTFTPAGAVADTTARKRLEDLYDGEIAWTDSQLSRLWAGIRGMGLADETLVLVTADHGEEFLEHGYVEHGRTLYQEITRVPMIASGPGIPSDSVGERVVSHLDLLPTILAAAGVEAPAGLPGRDLLGAGPSKRRRLPASGLNTGPPFRMAALRSGDRKVIWVPSADSAVMYRLESDPLEQRPLPPDSALLAKLESYWATPRRHPPVRSEMDVAPALRDLGYL